MRGLRSVLNVYIASLFPACAAFLLACATLLMQGCGHKGPLVAPERGDADNNRAASVDKANDTGSTAVSEPTTLRLPETHTH
ncbi:MAG TPA: hypothetical protein VIC26_09010 [Marinagarivorans sp.]